MVMHSKVIYFNNYSQRYIFFYLDIYILQLALHLFIVLYCCRVYWTKNNLVAGRPVAIPVFSKGRRLHTQLSASCAEPLILVADSFFREGL